MDTRKGYQTVYWGKMPVNFPPRVLRRAEVEEAVGYATRAFPDVLGLVPDFSSLAVGEDSERRKTAVLRLGDDDGTRIVRRHAVDANLKGLMCEIALLIRRRERKMRSEHARTT